MIEIWKPRWHDKKVLIAKYKVQDVNEIVFTKTKCFKGKTFRVLGNDIVKYPVESNGSILCYAVPLDIVLGQTEFDL
mgnify:CR=1 FL=1